jgi:hypothetical protein
VSALNLQLGELKPQNLAPFVGDTGLRSQVENPPAVPPQPLRDRSSLQR